MYFENNIKTVAKLNICISFKLSQDLNISAKGLYNIESLEKTRGYYKAKHHLFFIYKAELCRRFYKLLNYAKILNLHLHIH